MDGVAVIQSSFQGAQNWCQGTVGDVVAEQANVVPTRVVHPIGALMAHILNTEDFMISTLISGQPAPSVKGSRF